MNAILALLLAATPASFPGAPATGEANLRVEGRCLYSPELEEQAQRATLVACGEVTLGEGAVAFAPRGFPESLRFEGSWDGDAFTIERVVARGLGGNREAEGTCQAVTRDNQLVRLSCTATSGPRGYVANFVVPLL